MRKFKLIIFTLIFILFSENSYSQINEVFKNESEFESDATSLQSLNGLIASQRFGASVANCGDVNGDGFDDIVAGAHLTNSNTGRAYIYFGGQQMSSTPAIVLNGEALNNYFAQSVSSAGDVNGDGYNDVIVGAYGYSSNTGRAYIYFGGYNMDNIADVVITGPGTVSFGYSVSSAGDVNGDGFSDVMISGHGYSSNRGRAYIYYGGLIMDNFTDKTFEGSAAGGFFSFALSGAGDVNGDGYSDVIVGAYAVSSFKGAAYLYFGGADMDTISDVTFNGEANNNFLGQSVTGAGDVNGDGYSDILIGASLYSASTGRAYLYYGGGAMDNVADVTFTGEVTGSNFGRGLAGVGDVNGDGYSDIFIGAQSYSGSKGRAYLYYGGVSMNNICDMKMTGESANNYFGFSLAGGGDINGDGYKDFFAGAYGVSSNKGKVYIYKNSMTGTDIPDKTVYGNNGSEFGFSVSDAGDVNGDGYDDYIVGAIYSGSSYQGQAFIYFGSSDPDTIPDVILNGETFNSEFGASVSGAGDVNGDGYSDVIIGATAYSGGQGRIYIYFGGAPMDTIADFKKTGVAPTNFLGHSVSSAGDFNGDGYSDIVAGAPGYLSSRGVAYVFYGGSPMDTVVNHSFFGTIASESLGQNVSDAGDVNGDGYSDILISIENKDTSRGVVSLVFGNLLDIITLEGEKSHDNFGSSVSGAGDLNGDGFSDVIIGAQDFDNGSGYFGKCYVYFGSMFMDNISDLEYLSSYRINLGISVSGAGDINNDGFDDLIIGDELYFTGGRAYVSFGGYNMDNLFDVTMTSNNASENLGFSVSSAGDINADGLDDVLIGAPSSYNYEIYSGACYLYLSSAPSVKPLFISVKDVPNDQGGIVNLKWTRSGYDVTGINKITDYIVYRSYPPSGNGFSWEQRAMINAANHSFYTYTDYTPSDSSSGGNGTMYYQIMARTSNLGEYWFSGILYGRSIDNIAPLMVSPFTASHVLNNVSLNWKRSNAPDLLNYILFRSTNPEIDPNTEAVFAATTDSTFLDNSPLSGNYYYFIVAQDIHNNKSPVAIASSPNMTLNLTMFIEGFYDAGSNSQVSDSITVELRNSSSPFTIADQTNAEVNSDGTVQLKFANASNGNYYFVVKHRNAVETWSNAPKAFSYSTPLYFDMSSVSTQAYGSNQIQTDASPIRFAIYSGDVNQDGTIDLSDGSLIDNDAFNFESGYLPTDVNGDEVIDLADAVFADNNGFNFVGKVTP